MLQEAADWLDAFDRDPDSGVLLDARDHIAALVAEIAKLQSEIIALKDKDTKVLRSENLAAALATR